MRNFLQNWKRRAQELRTEVHALYLAYRDSQVPWHARLVAACVVAYFSSPIDLIPDPIPVLGDVDDLLLLPLGVALAIRLIPTQVMIECRAQAQARARERPPVNWVAAAVIVALWLVLAELSVRLVLGMVR